MVRARNKRAIRRPRNDKLSVIGKPEGSREPQSLTSEAAASSGSINFEARSASLFEPDMLASAQYFDTLRRITLLDPEKRLVLAILEDGIHSFQDNLFAATVKGKKLFAEAEAWVLEEGGDWIFSFANVCELLGMNAAYVRRGLVRWKDKQLAKHRGPGVWDGARMAG